MLSLNHYWRIVAAGLSYLLFGVGAFLPGLYIFSLALIPMDAATKQRKVRIAIKRLCRLYVDIMQFLGLMNYVVERPGNTSNRGEIAGHLVISNHSMLIDALFILGYIDNICCVVKSDLCTNFFTRLPIKLAGYVPNNDEQLVALTQEKLAAGENVLIFPEGTRNQYDLQLDFKRGASNIAVMSDSPILPIVLCCTPRALGKRERWYQLPDRKSRIVMRINPALRISDCVDSSIPRTRQYRQLTRWLRDYYTTQVSKIVEQSTAIVYGT